MVLLAGYDTDKVAEYMGVKPKHLGAVGWLEEHYIYPDIAFPVDFDSIRSVFTELQEYSNSAIIDYFTNHYDSAVAYLNRINITQPDEDDDVFIEVNSKAIVEAYPDATLLFAMSYYYVKYTVIDNWLMNKAKFIIYRKDNQYFYGNNS